MTTDPKMISQFEMPIRVENKAYIYALIDPRTSEIRYIGKSNNPSARVNSHMRDSVLARYKDPRTSWLKNLKADGLQPSLVILECSTEQEWDACERKWIAHFRETGVRLTNTLDGGNGRSKGCKIPRESALRGAAKRRGQKRSPETCAKLSAWQKGIKKPPEVIAKLHNGVRKWWANLSAEQRTAKMEKLWKPSMARMVKANAHGQIGVSWCKQRQKWTAYIHVRGKRIPLGRFVNFDEAVAARKAAEAKRFTVPLQTAA